MPDAMHYLKAVRRRVTQALADAAIAIPVGGAMRDVAILTHPPAAGYVPEGSLPAIYVFCRSDKVELSSQTTARAAILVDVTLQSYGNDDEALDHVDDMQLAAHLAIMADRRLGGVALNTEPRGSDTHTDSGEVRFGIRRVTFEVTLATPLADPTVTI